MTTDKLIKVSKQHAEAVYQIALAKLQKEKERHARKYGLKRR